MERAFVSFQSKNFDVYTPETLPHTKAWPSSELPPFIAVAHQGHLFHVRRSPNRFRDHFNPHQIPESLKGAHGFPNNVEDMHTTFLAYGPDFPKECEVKNKEDFYTYDIFPLMEKALFGKTLSTSTTTTSMTPSPARSSTTTGTTSTTTAEPEPEQPHALTDRSEHSYLWIFAVLLSLLLLLFLTGVVLFFFIKRRRKDHLLPDRRRLLEDLTATIEPANESVF